MKTKHHVDWLLMGLVATGLLSSCATLKSASTTDKISLNAKNVSQVSGQFERGEWDLWGADLCWNFYLESLDGDKVDFHVIDDKHIRVTLLDDTDTVKSRLMRGRIKEGRFVFHRRVKVYPLILGNVFKNSKVRITLTPSGDLMVDSRDLLYGHILFFPIADGHKKYDRVYKRLE
jgi:hypothetical protein